MRGKLIATYSIVVLITGLLAFVLMRAALGDLLSNTDRARQEAARSAAAAGAQLQLDGLTLQRWLTEQAMAPRLRDPFLADNPGARGDLATNQANDLYAQASSRFASTTPALVAFVDDQGVVLGRNSSALMRGEALGKIYPSLLDAVKRNTSGSDIWINRSRNEQLLTSYAPVRDDKGKVLGVIVLGTSIDEGRLSTISDLTSGREVALIADLGDRLDVIARSRNAPADVITAITQPGFKPAYQKAIDAPRPLELQSNVEGTSTAGNGLAGYGDGKRAALIGFSRVSLVDNLTSLLLPILGATAVGIVLAIICAILLGNYITQPIVTLEEGLLGVINGDTNRRFEIEHAEFGGLVSRINTLLDTLLGVEEDNTDAQGRPSNSPSVANFRDAMGVDGGAPGRVDPAALHREPAAAYHQRLYSEYIQAKRSIGDPVDHITPEAFVNQINTLEREAAERQGKPVRFRAEVQGREVKLIAVPLE
ncbi:MAG: hypothetical protein EOO74_00955 [Myxococcales bacterium]|nr:MAG: hypothetical protein EOO74_00955 [Myxococcales bacterium]